MSQIYCPFFSSLQMVRDPNHLHKKCYGINCKEVLCWLFPVFFSSFIFTHAFSRNVISERELGKGKKKNKQTTPSSKRNLHVPPANCHKLLWCQASLLTVKMCRYESILPVLSIADIVITLGT